MSSRLVAVVGFLFTTIVDSTLGQALNCIGSGLLYCENVTRLRGNSFISLRQDYGATWEGDAVLINCVHEAFSNDAMTARSGNGVIFNGSPVATWDFGYITYMPQNITIDNFRYGGSGTCFVFNDIKYSASLDPVNPYQPPKSITFRNMKALKTSGYAGTDNDICKNTKIFTE